jgi:hypothetical protein
VLENLIAEEIMRGVAAVCGIIVEGDDSEP